MLKKLAVCSLAVAMFGAGSVAFAHTSVKDKGVEGTTLYTAFTIGHGCASSTNTTPLPVIAQAVLFPNDTTSKAFKLTPNANPALPDTETAINLANHIVGAAVNGGLLTLSPKAVQNNDIFAVSRSVINAAGSVRALRFRNGVLDTTMTGVVPFRVSGVKFVKNDPTTPAIEPTTCANKLLVRIAVANWCKTAIDDADNASDTNRRADFWMGVATTKFNNPELVETIGSPTVASFWPTLTIERDLVNNPLPASCNGVGYTIAVQPSNADIDANLPMLGYPNGN
jgi:hypothetical protein